MPHSALFGLSNGRKLNRTEIRIMLTYQAVKITSDLPALYNYHTSTNSHKLSLNFV